MRRLTQLAKPHITALAEVLVDCVAGGASVSFMAPLSMERAEAFWTRIAAHVARGERALLVAELDGRIVGTVHLVLDLPENQPHRADVSKMLVHRDVRRRGVGAQLIRGVEALARDLHRSMLVLDTVTGGDAERLYAGLGWTRVGEVPAYALLPQGGLCSTTFFYRSVSG